jgi:N-acetylneuraminic acid mutarotase
VTLSVLIFIPLKAQWQTMQPMPNARAQTTCSVLEGLVYVLGGLTAPTDMASTEVNIYDPATDTWLSNAPDLPEGLCAAASCSLDGKIYFIGGHPTYSPTDARSSVYAYDPAEGGSWTTLPPMIKPRFYHRAVTLDGKIYVMGGRSIDIENSMEKYDPITNNWTLLANMNAPRALHTAEVFDGKIYVFGSQDTQNTDVDVYDPVTDTWTIESNWPTSLLWHGSGVIGDKIFIYGGFPAYNVWEYDPTTGTAETQIESTIPDSIIWFSYATVEDESGHTCIYSFGGGFNSFFTGSPPPFVTDAVFKYCNFIMDVNEAEKEENPVQVETLPNPGGTYTVFRFNLQYPENLTLKIYNMNGQEITTVYQGYQAAGDNEIVWNSSGLPSGIYVYHLKTRDWNFSGKCFLRN